MALIAILLLVLVAAALRGWITDTRDTDYSMRIDWPVPQPEPRHLRRGQG
jgi:hypothetical protein